MKASVVVFFDDAQARDITCGTIPEGFEVEHGSHLRIS